MGSRLERVRSSRRAPAPYFDGEYQIGDVYARSVVIIATSFGIVMPNFLAS